MLEKIILFIILIAAVSYVVYTFFLNKNRDCGCGCGKNCKSEDKK